MQFAGSPILKSKGFFHGRSGGIPSWVTTGPDGALPTDFADFANNRGWYNGRAYGSIASYIDAASGTFLRGSDATYFDKNGILQTAGPNVLRLTHDPLTGEQLGYLPEGSAQEMLVRNNTDGWANTNNFASIDPVPSIFSGKTAWKHTSDGTGSRFRYVMINNLIEDTDYRLNVIVEETDNRPNQIDFTIWPSGGNLGMGRFVYETGVLFAAAGSISDPLVQDWGIGPNGGKIWHLSFTARSRIGDPSSVPFYLYACGINEMVAGNTAIIHYVGVQPGNVSSSPILTGSTTATRMADNLSFARSSPPEFTMVVEGTTASGLTGNQVLWQWDDGTESNRYRLVRDNARILRAIMTVSGVDVVNLNLGAVADRSDLKVAFPFKAGMFAASVNGAAAVVDAAYSGPLPVVTTKRIGCSAVSGSEWFGTVERPGRFDKAYNPAQAQEMSS